MRAGAERSRAPVTATTRGYTATRSLAGIRHDTHVVQDHPRGGVSGGALEPRPSLVFHDDRQGPEWPHRLGTDPPHRPVAAADRADPAGHLGGMAASARSGAVERESGMENRESGERVSYAPLNRCTRST